MSPVVRAATEADLEAFYGEERPRQSMRALVVDLDGRIIGIAGLIYQRRGLQPFFFSDMKPEMRKYPRVMLRGARRMLAAFGVPGLIAIACPNERNAPKLLERLGFVHVGVCPDGEIFMYEGAR